MKSTVIQYTVTPSTEEDKVDFQKLTDENIAEQFTTTIEKTLAGSVLITVVYDDKKIDLKQKTVKK